MKKLSVVVPSYNEEESIPLFYEEINKISVLMNYLEFEVIFVDDGSSDNTLNVVKDLRKKDKRVRYISFSRNFGKESAIYAGLEAAEGDYVTLMDADLQDPPTLLPEMYRLITEEDYDVVGTRRVTRKGEPPIRSFFARMFYKIINRMSNVEMVDGARDYRLMKMKVVKSILSMPEYNRYSKGLFAFVGFKTKWLEYENIQRVAGETKWSFWKLFKYALEGIIAFTTTPLVVISLVGLVMFFIAFLAMLLIIVRRLSFGDPVAGWASLVCFILFTSGIQLLCLGIIGQYLSKTYLEVKRRPIYIISETEKIKD